MTILSDFYLGTQLAIHDLGEAIHNNSYTFVLNDIRSQLHKSTDSGEYTWTIPLNSSVDFPIGSVLTIYNEGAGNITLTADGASELSQAGTFTDTDVTIGSGTLCTVIQISADKWVFSGGGPTLPIFTKAEIHFIGGM